MRFVDEFRNKELVNKVADKIKAIAPREPINIMEVCGTHTHNFYRFGLDKLLPKNVRLIAGPGCPVCVSSQGYIDQAIRLSREKDVIIATFADMLRVPGSVSSLEKERANGGNVHLVYSPTQAIELAGQNPQKRTVFLAVGFETTIPAIGLSVLLAKKYGIKNLFFFSSLKLIPPAMKYLLCDKRLGLDGFLCPGHVSAIIGTRPYEFIAKRYKLNCCIAGFEPLDIMEGLYLIIHSIRQRKSAVENQYFRAVRAEGNIRAQKIVSEVFKVYDSCWRGLGMIPQSGLALRKKLVFFDAERAFSLSRQPDKSSVRLSRCRCGDVLKGLILPRDCPLFSAVCTPDNPVGPCMVSIEGACNAYYKYRR